MKKLLILFGLILSHFLVSCTGTKFISKTTDPNGVVTETVAKVPRGTFGMVPTKSKRGGNSGGGANQGGGALFGLLPRFAYDDNSERVYAEATNQSSVTINAEGIKIDGPWEQQTFVDTLGHWIWRGERTAFTGWGWGRMWKGFENINASNNATDLGTVKSNNSALTSGIVDDNATSVLINDSNNLLEAAKIPE